VLVKKEFSDTEKRAFFFPDIRIGTLTCFQTPCYPAAAARQAGFSQFGAEESNFIPGKAVGCGLYRNKGTRGFTGMGPMLSSSAHGPLGPIPVKAHGWGALPKCKDLSHFFFNWRKMKNKLWGDSNSNMEWPLEWGHSAFQNARKNKTLEGNLARVLICLKLPSIGKLFLLLVLCLPSLFSSLSH
jgi:hypothetical protein